MITKILDGYTVFKKHQIMKRQSQMEFMLRTLTISVPFFSSPYKNSNLKDKNILEGLKLFLSEN